MATFNTNTTDGLSKDTPPSSVPSRAATPGTEQNILAPGPARAGTEEGLSPAPAAQQSAKVNAVGLLLETLHKDMDQRYNHRLITSKSVKPWMLHKGSASEKPKVWIPISSSNSNLECLFAELILQLSPKFLDFEVIEKDVKLDLTLSSQVESSLIGFWAAVSNKRPVGPESSFPTAGHPVDLGYTALLAESATCYVDEPKAGRGFFKQLIPTKFVGSAGSKRYLADILGQLRTACSREEHSEVAETLHWLLHKWAYENRSTVGATVLRNQRIRWDSVKRKSLPYTVDKRRVKGQILESIRYSVPKNVGDSPLLTPTERTLLKRLAQLSYYGPLARFEQSWKEMSAQLQHDYFEEYVKKIGRLHEHYVKEADKLSSRIFKRKKLYEKALGKPEPKNTKKKKVTSTMLSKHMVELTSDMAKDPSAQAKVPFAYNIKMLLKGTTFEEIFDKILDQSSDVEEMIEYCEIDSVLLRKITGLFQDSYLQLASKHTAEEINSVVVSNSFEILTEDKPDPTEGKEPQEEQTETTEQPVATKPTSSSAVFENP